MKRLLCLLLLMPASFFAFALVPAGAVEVILAGNASPKYGLDSDAVVTPLKGLAAKLFRYKDVEIVDAVNVPKDTFEQRVGAAARAAKTSEFEQDYVILYYLGLGAHDETGKSYLVPYEWTGEKGELIELAAVVSGMRKTAGKKSLIVLDIVDTDASLWPDSSLRPGLGRIDREAGDGSVQIAYFHGKADGENRTMFTASFEEELSKPGEKPVELMQLASLVQADVSFKSGGASVPRLIGTMLAPVSLNQLGDEEVDKKNDACLAENQKRAQFASAANAGTRTDAVENFFMLLCPFAWPFKEHHAVPHETRRHGGHASRHAYTPERKGRRGGGGGGASAGANAMYVPN